MIFFYIKYLPPTPY